MRIDNIMIKNYRGLNVEINLIEKIATIIGQNDSGKSNICEAILKVLDFEKRKKAFLDTDSTMGNKEPIEIRIKILLDDLTVDQYATIREYIHRDDEDNKYVVARLFSEYNKDILEYEDNLYLGDPDIDEIEVPVYKMNPLDKIMSVIYINPSYNKEKDEKQFFLYKEENNKEEQKVFSSNIESKIEELKQNIQSEKNILEMQDEINEYGKFGDLLDKIRFEIVPNIRLNNIYKSLDILTIDENGKELNNIGDGKNKIFSMLLKSKIYSDDKKKIYIVEEPENHLYVLLQKYYVEALKSLNPEQLIITTHSPHIVDFEKTNQIIKLDYNPDENTRNILKYKIDNMEFKKLGYLINSEVAEMLYYNNVLLVEGESEKYFYNLLLIKDSNFHKYILENRFGIFSVNGIAFETIKKLLEALGVKVFIKTDNDIFKVQNSKNTFRYAGIERCIKYLNDVDKQKIKKILNWEDFRKDRFRYEGDNKKIKVIEDNIEEIADIMYNSKILMSVHNDGFEKDFLDYINYPLENYDEAFKYLKQAKLKNLYDFITENTIDISINENNKNSVLVRFMND